MNPPRIRPAHVRQALAALEAIVPATRPADALMQELFRAHPQMGARDRAEIAGLVYGVLRNLRALQAGAAADAATLLARHLVWDRHAPMPEGLGLADPGAPPPTLTPAERFNLSDSLYADLVARLGADDTAALAEALRKEGSVDLRVNALRARREQAVTALSAANLAVTPTPWSPWGLRLTRRAPLQSLPAFREGWIEPQDEGSQLLALLLAPRPGERVVDFCAGAGGKTLALGAQMDNRGELLALDTAARRLEKLPPRAARAGLRNVRTRALRDEADPALAAEAGGYDAVLVDAPCSGSGTLRRHPELLLRHFDTPALTATQLSILRAAARLLRPGGRLVYATCSLARAENADVIARFLADAPDFAEADAGAALQAQGVPWREPRLELLPHRHHTDGFFAVLLTRTR